MALWKSKQEKEIERDIEFRRGVAKIKGFVKKNQDIQKRYWSAGKKALQMGDQERFRRFAKGHVACGEQVRKWESFLLDLEMLDVRRDQVKASNSFLGSLRALSGSMLAQAGPEDLAKVQVDMDRALAKGESLEQALDVVMEMSGTGIFAMEEPEHDDAILDMQATMTRELGGEADESLDRRIDEGIDKIEAAMKEELR